MGKQWKQWETLFFLVSKITADGDCNYEIKRLLLLKGKAMTNLDSTLKSRDFTDKVPSSQSYSFSSSHVWIWELDHKEGWALKNWCFWTVVLEKTLESPLDCKTVHPKGNQSWIFIGRTDPEAELQFFGHLMWRTDSFEKTLMLGKIEGRKRRGWYWMRWMDGITNLMDMSFCMFQGSLACRSPWVHKESDRTEWLKWLSREREHKYVWFVVTGFYAGSLSDWKTKCWAFKYLWYVKPCIILYSHVGIWKSNVSDSFELIANECTYIYARLFSE